MGNNGRKLVKGFYSWPKIARTILQLYEKALAL